jgi:hypothetical protein
VSQKPALPVVGEKFWKKKNYHMSMAQEYPDISRIRIP